MSEHYDVIIAGGGFAGLCCALHLKGKKVLLLETRIEIARKHRSSRCSLYPTGEKHEVDGNDIYFHKNKIRAHNAFMGRLSYMKFAAGEQKLIANTTNPSIVVDEGTCLEADLASPVMAIRIEGIEFNNLAIIFNCPLQISRILQR